VADAAMPDPLAELRDIHLPPDIDVWPPAPGWWILAALVILGVLFACRYAYRTWQKGAYRREARSQLQNLFASHQHDQQAFLLGYNSLLKRVALTTFPREDVANLTGEAWVAFLDATGQTHEFTMGPGQVLIDGQYAPVTTADIERLHDLGQTWIKTHQGVAA
jgi:hypothetical protein